VPGLIRNREQVQESAAEIGTATSEVVTRLLDDPVVDRLHSAGRLIRLQERFGNERLEAACVRALHLMAPAPPAKVFARPAEELLGDLAGGVSWN